jgi:hypothetical protein
LADSIAQLTTVADHFSDQLWRLHNLYMIQDKEGNEVRFQPNWAQTKLLENFWYMNAILKARQLGMTTFIDILLLDNACFYPNTRCGIIAHTREDAKVIFQTKVKFPYEHLPDQIRAFLAPRQDTTNEYLFSNDSSIRVGTSMRSGTLNYLHISEYGKLCAKYPEKASEVRTGALNTVQAGQSVTIESTAEGSFGHFYDICEDARNMARLGTPLTTLDWRFHFFPWWRESQYVLPDDMQDRVTITRDDMEYFEELETEIQQKLTLGQKLWYIKKKMEQGEFMLREYPSTPDEAFRASIEGAYYKQQMAYLRQQKQIARVPYDPRLPVNTFWDLGMSDDTHILFHQKYGMENRFIDEYYRQGESLGHYSKVLQGKPYTYGQHFFPHDVEVREMASGISRRESLLKLGVRPLRVVPRIEEEMDGIDAVRSVLPTCWFDQQNCAQTIKCLDHYRKEWDDKLGSFKSKPLHDWASHGAKAFECFATGFKAPSQGKKRKKKQNSWRTV